MVTKEIIKNDRSYIVGIKETKNKKKIYCYILKKGLFGYKKLFCHESIRTLIPDYNRVSYNAIYEYEKSLWDKERLLEWSASQ
ncbi:MAG: hypothetical protein K0R54_584 [Clostridiaceae bacterium]|nr:hypothetical protein [Clostridiaceae bacterium]